MFTKQNTYRSEAWRRAVAALPCVVCFREGESQAAHVNHIGKGMGMNDDDLMADILADARRAVDDNARHSHDSLFAKMSDWYPDATDEQIEAAVSQVLG